jgi:guanylate kinase
MLFVISAPSGAGKTTIIRELFKLLPDLRFSVSATTRAKRVNETDGKDYYFISREKFEKKIKNNEFIEWEEVHDNLYGTLKSEVENNIDKPYDIIFDVDVKGALSIKKIFPGAVTIFLDAPKDDLLERLKKRKTEPEELIQKRLNRMEMELKFKDRFDYIVLNRTSTEGAKKAVNNIIEIIKRTKEFNI